MKYVSPKTPTVWAAGEDETGKKKKTSGLVKTKWGVGEGANALKGGIVAKIDKRGKSQKCYHDKKKRCFVAD